MSNVTPIRACDMCEQRRLDVKNRGHDTWMCDGCYETPRYDEAAFTEDPDDDTTA